MSESMIVRNDASHVSFTATAVALKSGALEQAALVGKVSNASEQETAVIAQKELARVLKLAEEARVAAKNPVLDFGRKIDSAAKEFVAEIQEEKHRIDSLVADFQYVEMQRVRAAEVLRLAELDKLEIERQKKLAEAKSHDEIDAIQDEHCRTVASLPVAIPAREKGQNVREDWEIEITNEWELARNHPTCVKLTPLLSEIRQLLNSGASVKGVRAKKVVKASVSTREQKPIEV